MKASIIPASVSIEERNRIILAHLHLIDKVVNRLKRSLPTWIEAEELHSMGVIGLIKAAERFDADRADVFPDYALLRIRGAILDKLRRDDPMSHRARMRIKLLNKKIAEFEQTNCRAPTDPELRQLLGLSEGRFLALKRLIVPIELISIDCFGSNSIDTSHEYIEDVTAENPQEHLCVTESVLQIHQLLDSLTENERSVIQMYYFENYTLARIGIELNLTEGRICQIHKATIQKMKGLFPQLHQ